MISDIRQDIANLVETVSPDRRQWTDALNYDNIPCSLLDRTYHIEYTLGAITRQQMTEQQAINVTVRVFFDGQRDTVAEFDNAMDESETIKSNIVSLINLPEDYVSIVAASLDVEPISVNNDNKMVGIISVIATKINCIS